MKVSHSLSFKIGALVALLILVLIGVLFGSYAANERRSVIDSEVQAARNLILMAESVRENMEKKWKQGLFSTEGLKAIAENPGLSKQEKKEKILGAVPVVTAWESAKAKADEGGFEFRSPRGDARNPDNEPDVIESKALARFRKDPSLEEYYMVDADLNAIRYFRPVRLGEACMVCHGDPARSGELWGRDDGKDITGFTMDNKQVGDLHGAFEIIRPLDEADAAIQASLLGGTGIVAALLGVVLVILWQLLKYFINRPLAEAVALSQRVAEGDLTGEIVTQRRDEVGQMLRTLGSMKTQLQTVVGRIRQASDQIAGASSEIASGNMDLSQRTEEQAASLEETSSSMEELTSTVKANADNARQSNQLADEARNRAEKGGDVVRETVQAMTEINASSARVADIVSVIDDIAFQTNILALNAAVEAARAGDQGRGFAVVAAEVRKLAQRSTESAREIRDLIQESTGKVEDGTRLVEASGKSLEEIIIDIKKVSDIVGEIASASTEQSAGIEQVNQAVSQMDDVAQQNASLVEESTAASESLEDQARELKKLIAYFRVEDENEVREDAEAPAQDDNAETREAKGATRVSLVASNEEYREDEWKNF
jgi:methyl-accepting chemotaxis protein